MFATACEEAWKFTRPVVVVMNCLDGKCRSVVSSYVVVNEEGWILTAHHVKKLLEDLGTTARNVQGWQAQHDQIESDTRLSTRNRKQRLKALGHPPKDSPEIFATWWGQDGQILVDTHSVVDADLLLGRLEPFNPGTVQGFPTFKNPASLIRQGTSLCRLGFPFPDVEITYDKTKRNFDVSKMNLPRFAIEGILTRQITHSQNAAGYPNSYLETSSPGLKGQSGGPIVDVNGVVWGIQSQTRHLSLGFDPEVPGDPSTQGHRRKEHQFLNVGWSTHPATVAGLLHERGVKHKLSL